MKDLITLEPQCLQFSHDRKQLIKVTNCTSEPLDNCFFCMFNTNKYQFSPESFPLEPNEQKLITVTFKLKNNDTNTKDFAYLKTKNISKRIIIHNSPLEYSEEKLRSPQSGVEELQTLSSRVYRQTQQAAYDKIIEQKDAYIKRLQRKIDEQEDSVRKIRTVGTGQKNKNFYISEIQELEIKIDIINQEKQKILKQNILLQQKFQNYRKGCNTDQSNSLLQQKLIEKQELIQRQIDQINYLEAECEELLKKFSQKQLKFREMEENNKQLIVQLKKDNEQRLQQLQKRIDQQKSSSQQSRVEFEQKIKKLGKESLMNNKLQKQIQTYEREIEEKKKKFEKLEKKLNQFESERKKMMKLQLEKQNLQEKNRQLASRVNVLQKSVDELKQQTIIYRSKIVDQDSSTDKAGHYIQVALESCKNENEILKKNKIQLEYSIAELSRCKSTNEGNILDLQNQMEELRKQIKQLIKNKEQFQQKQRISRQESHQTIMKLKSENIDLIEKMSLGPRKNQLDQSKNHIQKMQEQIQASRIREKQLRQKLKVAEESKQKMVKKVDKLKKQAKKQLRSIEDNVLDELKRVHGEKKILTKKVQELQNSVQSETFDQTRNKTKTHYDATNTLNIKSRDSKSQQGQKRVGIKDQRKELEESHSNSRHGIDYEGLYCELGELREFRNYVVKQLHKYGHSIGSQIIQNQNQKRSIIFEAINFFSDLDKRLSEEQPERKRMSEAERQIEFLKGRLTQLDCLKKDGQLIQQDETIQLAKGNHDKTLLEFVRQQMKTQYKKLYEALKLNEEKYDILKKKIYEEYRVRLIELLAKKDKDERTVGKVQSTLQRFIDGLSNLSHKEAVLAKQIKLKQNARKQASTLRQKVNNLTQLLQNKKGYCSRQTVKVYNCENQNQWYDNIRLEAQLLTYQAENARLIEEVNLSQNQNKSLDEQFKNCLADLEKKQGEITKLKKEVLKIDREREHQAERSRNQIENLQKKFNQFQKVQMEVDGLTHRDKQFNALKQDLHRKKELIKNLKDKQKMLENLLQSTNRANSEIQERQRRQHLGEVRMQESLRQFKEGNRELRAENIKLKQIIESLEEQLNRKNAALKRLKSEGDEHRIKIAKGSSDDFQKLRNEIRDLKDDLRKGKEDYDKLRKRKDKQIQELESQIKRIKNEFLIEKRSLQSIIRALIDTIRRIYCALDIIVRKKWQKSSQSPNFEQLLSNPGQIDSLRVYQSFEPLLDTLKQPVL